MLSSRLEKTEGRTSETVLELFYKLQVMPCLALQPDIQYFVNPGANGKNALAFTIRLQFTP